MESKVTNEEIRNAFDQIDSVSKKLEKIKADGLIKSVSSLGENKKIIDQIKEKGLPKNIFVWKNCGQELIQSLSFYSKVYEHPFIKEQSIIFSWDEENFTNRYNPVPEFFDSPKFLQIGKFDGYTIHNGGK